MKKCQMCGAQVRDEFYNGLRCHIMYYYGTDEQVLVIQTNIFGNVGYISYYDFS